MKKYFIIIFSMLFSALMLGFIIEDEPLKKILTQIEKYRLQFPQEKVHLHLDKPYYAIGDNIWFKAYVVNAEKNELSNLSKILYVELINDKDSIKKSLKIPLEMGLTWGDFTLSDSLREGNYRIRAYTTWMRNFGEEYFFDKTITIGNSISNTVLTQVDYTYSKDARGQKVSALINYSDMAGQPLANKEVSYHVELDFRSILKGKGITDAMGNLQVSFVNNQPFVLKSGRISTTIRLDEKNSANKNFPVKSTSNESVVQFFPESGDLVNGISSRIGFKAVSSDGLGINVGGYISNQNNVRMVDFKSEHAGMGHFRLRPDLTDTYTAHIIFEDGSEKSYPLPQVKANGYVLSVSNTNTDDLKIIVSTNEVAKPDEEITLIAQTNGQVHFVSKNKLSSKTFNASIPKNRFPSGILQLTLFSAQNEPVAERLVFINHSDFLKIDLSTDKPEYKKREKVKLTLDTKDPLGKATMGSFSIAILDESKVPFHEADETTIMSNLLLSSDLKGFIEQPNYYFDEINEDKIRQLDILLLTQGWRRFEWRNILSDNYPTLVYQPETNLQVSGKVTTVTGRPVVGGKVTLFSASGDVFMLDTLTNANGEFKFDNLYFNDSTKFVIQARNEKDRKNVEILLDRIPPQLVTKNKNEAMLEVNVNRSMLSYLKNSRTQYDEFRRYGVIGRNILLDEVRIVERKQEVKHSANLNSPGRADAIIKADQLQNCFDLAICLQGRVAGLIIRNGMAYLMRNMSASFRGPIPMEVVVDGMFLGAEFLSSINVQDVETIEVLRSGANTAIYGSMGGGGLLIITTKRGEVNNNYRSYSPGIMSYKPQGFFKGREFYSPDYDDPAINVQIPDLRTTIYWNPNVVSDSTGKASVEFFNSDGTGNYKAIVEGININGSIGRKIFRYNVK
ncbi:MAG: TonB-dependent receptor plug domain-containing protein [Daejeonella sp.]|uniref:TonB-dependent receptor n=1 Tax=Daejeonella sp. TaxID=2805397 RepID=UPI002736AF07|nr:TonB-dependent receptor plug domain-containing protein [Daejeonella sp.]MDP3466840.1 TonB-dependent receptor plug domain-containing protein [Daejeonella sp.]